MLIGTLPAGATTTVESNFIPQFVVFRGAAAGDISGDLFGQINVEGDGIIFNLPTAAGFGAMANIHQMLPVADKNTTVGNVFQLANGLVTNKTSYWTFTNNDAAAVNIYGWSEEKPGDTYFTYGTQLALQNSGNNYSKFGWLGIPAFGATDVLSILYNDNTMDANLSANELRARVAYGQNVPQIAIDNINPARVKQVTYIPTANRDTFVMRYQAVAGAVNANMNAGR